MCVPEFVILNWLNYYILQNNKILTSCWSLLSWFSLSFRRVEYEDKIIFATEFPLPCDVNLYYKLKYNFRLDGINPENIPNIAFEKWLMEIVHKYIALGIMSTLSRYTL